MDIRIKGGASLNLHLQFVNDDGSPFDLTGATIASHVADDTGALVAQLSVVVDGLPAAGAAYIQVSDTSAWPAEPLVCDVLVRRSGLVVISETFPVYVLPPVTRL